MPVVGEPFRVATNLGAVTALNNFQQKDIEVQNLRRISATGLKLNEYSDNPSNFKMSDGINARTRGLAVALDNVATARNILLTGESSLKEIQDILLKVKELTTLAANDTLGDLDRTTISQTIAGLTNEIDDVVAETLGSERRLLDGSYVNISYQTGEKTTSTFRVDIAQDHRALGLGIDAPNVADKVFTTADSRGSMTKVDQALELVGRSLEAIGAYVVRLNVQEETLAVEVVNSKAANSRIKDADMAQTQMDSTRMEIIQHASRTQLVQAMLMPQKVMALFN